MGRLSTIKAQLNLELKMIKLNFDPITEKIVAQLVFKKTVTERENYNY